MDKYWGLAGVIFLFASWAGCESDQVTFPGTGGSGNQGGSAAGGAGATSAGGGGSGGTTPDGGGGVGGGPCTEEQCASQGFTCCDDGCVATYNDINNCGECGHECHGEHPFCAVTDCGTPPCTGAALCNNNQFCCGQFCCDNNQLCCVVPGPGPTAGPECVTPDETGTCPPGNPLAN